MDITAIMIRVEVAGITTPVAILEVTIQVALMAEEAAVTTKSLTRR